MSSILCMLTQLRHNQLDKDNKCTSCSTLHTANQILKYQNKALTFNGKLTIIFWTNLLFS